MKKFHLIALVLVLTMLLAACRGNRNKETTPTTRATTHATTEAPMPSTMFTEPTMGMTDPSMGMNDATADTHGNIGDRDNGIIGDDTKATDSTQHKNG